MAVQRQAGGLLKAYSSFFPVDAPSLMDWPPQKGPKSACGPVPIVNQPRLRRGHAVPQAHCELRQSRTPVSDPNRRSSTLPTAQCLRLTPIGAALKESGKLAATENFQSEESCLC